MPHSGRAAMEQAVSWDEGLSLCFARLFLAQDDVVLTADASPENRAWLRAHLGPHVLKVVDKGTLLAHLTARHGATLLNEAVFGLARRFPDLSAQTVITRPQMVFLALFAGLGMVALALAPVPAFRVMAALLSLAFAAAGIFRAMLAILATLRPAPLKLAGARSLPTYTILVPLYREAAVLPQLVRSLGELDYPAHLLDI